MKKIALMLVLIAGFSTAYAESRYVTDQFKITMRSGESATHKIIRMLPSGYQLELLGANRESGYSRVRAKDGTTGFVLTRQLMKIPSARDRLQTAEVRLKELQEEPGRLSSKLASLQDAHKKLGSEHQQLQQQKQEIDLELRNLQRTASNAVRISNERNELRKQVVDLTQLTEELKQENRELKNDSAQHWFLIGAGVIVGGILLGLILPKLRINRRKSSWGSL
ncbi:MAG: TIGR04211 family SH3 domain-containing protein [Sedimenticola sp.]